MASLLISELNPASLVIMAEFSLPATKFPCLLCGKMVMTIQTITLPRCLPLLAIVQELVDKSLSVNKTQDMKNT